MYVRIILVLRMPEPVSSKEKTMNDLAFSEEGGEELITTTMSTSINSFSQVWLCEECSIWAYFEEKNTDI